MSRRNIMPRAASDGKMSALASGATYFSEKASYGKHQIEKKFNTNGKLSRINLCAHLERGTIKSITLADNGVYKYPSNFVVVVVVVFVRHTTVVPFHSFIMVSVFMII